MTSKNKFKKGELVKFVYRNEFGKTVKAHGNIVGFRKRFYRIKTTDGAVIRIYGNQIDRITVPEHAFLLEKEKAAELDEDLKSKFPGDVFSWPDIAHIINELETIKSRLGWIMLAIGITMLMVIFK